MKIIVNADDFGFSDETVNATIESFEHGALTSATIMATMPGFGRAAEYAHAHPQFSFGAHLTFSSDGVEHPKLPPAELPGITQSNGQFLGPIAVRGRALWNNLPVDQIAREMTAQLQTIRDAGVPLSHVDSHGHLHKFKPFRLALQRVLPALGIRRVRTVQDMYLRRPIKSPTYWLSGVWRKRLSSAYVTTEHLFLPTSAWDEGWDDKLLAKLAGAAGTLELGVHPGYNEPWRKDERVTTERFVEKARAAGHTLITWNDL